MKRSAPSIVLGIANRTDGAVAGEPDAMVALRCAADQPVAWHRQGVPAIAGHGAARPNEPGEAHRLPDEGDGSIARSAGARLAQDCRPSSVGRGHLMDICGRSLIWVRCEPRLGVSCGVPRPTTRR